MLVVGELGEVFSVRDARAAGIPERALRRLEAPLHGARAEVSEEPRLPWERDAARLRRVCRAYLAVSSGDFAFSHATAAALHGITIPRRLEAEPTVHVSVTAGQPRRAGVITHRVRELRVGHAGDLPVVSPELAWLQLATELSRDELVIAGDSLVRRKRPLSTIARLKLVVRESKGVRGVRGAGDALALVRAGTDSPRESEVRLVLVHAGLPEPVVQHTVHHEGYWVGTPDLAYIAERIAIEYQGQGHRDEKVFEEDIARIERFRDAGWEVIQVTARQLRDPRAVVERVRVALARRGSGVHPA